MGADTWQMLQLAYTRARHAQIVHPSDHTSLLGQASRRVRERDFWKMYKSTDPALTAQKGSGSLNVRL